MTPVFYDEKELERRLHGRRSLFLAGPTSRGVARTPWRARALELLARFEGVVVLPEFEAVPFEVGVPTRYCHGDCPIPGLRVDWFNVLHWETVGLETTSAVLFWMPFNIADADSPDSLPGFTTRGEVARELTRAPRRLALGMPAKVLSGGHIRFHAHRAGVKIHDTLEATVDAALALLSR